MPDAQSSRLRAREHPLAIPLRYALFAVAAGAVNLLTQEIVFRLSPVKPLAASIFAGTAAGFIVKYFLDKHWIFFDGYGSAAKEARKVVLYASFSVATTLIFWGFELAFLAIGGTARAKYTGAVIGLVIGNVTKYLLDRSFTFNPRARLWK
ncbi:MAG: GtrA family protein [Beijerinckiaceae bacterium]|nr:GtrA family protein [Beijerinckiaceae bacterium]MCI0597938.1 GtrA family protein [Beijerinckiaceae bacterium]MCI0736544.1 GtrA family protein [Beijerinckiaceae bacterium]